ncbi:porin [Pandoraea sputorum]|uniref:porin n=1 Tax=Pandoraea sputorum TaxID=93222 RepID=UPI0012419ECD|nr:porin [Pandoraea sputorum]VVE55721.1 porin [Pandoraea sputorum]
MRKSRLAMAVLGAFAGTAHAQSSVTLYGIIDAGLTYVSSQGAAVDSTSGSRNVKFSSGNLQGSRWGLSGSEDLGGGLKAIFTLENGFDLGNGTASASGKMFGRQAYVGLTSASAGAITIGRQYDSVVDFVGPFASGSQWATFSGAHIFDNDNLNNSFRINNSIKYTTANYNGLSAGALYGFSNQANGGKGSGFANNRAWSAGLGYANGPLALGVGYLYLSGPAATSPLNAGGAVSGDYTSYPTTLDAEPADSMVARQQVLAAGGSYAFGPATVGLVYSHSTFGYEDDQGHWKFNNVELNAKYMLTPALQLGVAYIYTWSTLSGAVTEPGGVSQKIQQVNLGLDYWLSKRTDAYLVGLWQHASNDGSNNAQLNGQPFAAGINQFVVTAGVRHKF